MLTTLTRQALVDAIRSLPKASLLELAELVAGSKSGSELRSITVGELLAGQVKPSKDAPGAVGRYQTVAERKRAERDRVIQALETLGEPAAFWELEGLLPDLNVSMIRASLMILLDRRVVVRVGDGSATRWGLNTDTPDAHANERGYSPLLRGVEPDDHEDEDG